MQKLTTIKLLPSEAANAGVVKKYLSQANGVTPDNLTGYNILKSSIDARGKKVFVHLQVQVFINEPFQKRDRPNFEFPLLKKNAKKVIIIGAGPAGLFAALKLMENGICPIILERGKDVRSRRRDLAMLNKEGIVNP